MQTVLHQLQSNHFKCHAHREGETLTLFTILKTKKHRMGRHRKQTARRPGTLSTAMRVSVTSVLTAHVEFLRATEIFTYDAFTRTHKHK